jgi:hypothetical protein
MSRAEEMRLKALTCECHHHYLDHDDFTCTITDCDCSLSLKQLTPKPNGCEDSRILPDGRLATMYKTLTGYRILIGPIDDMMGGDEVIDFRLRLGMSTMCERDRILIAWNKWDGYGYPEGYYRRSIKPANNDPDSDGWVRVDDGGGTKDQFASGGVVGPVQGPFPSPPPATRILKYGDRGDDVRILKWQLAELGYLPKDAVDDSFASQTKNALVHFQADNNLIADGIVGPKTGKALMDKTPLPF